MRQLFQLALRSWGTIRLICLSIVCLFVLTAAEKAEVFSYGVLLDRGADFFVLFAPEKEGKLSTPPDAISKHSVDKRWSEISGGEKKDITRQDASKFIVKKEGGSLVERLQAYLETHFNLRKNIFHLILLVAITAIFKGISFFGSKYTTSLVATRISKDLRTAYFEHVQSLPMDFFQKNDRGMIATRVMGDSGNIALAISSSLFHYIQTPFVVLFSLILCLKMSWQLSIVIYVVFPLIVLPIAYFSSRVRKVSRAMQKNQETFTSFLMEYLTGVYTTKLFSSEAFSLQRFSRENEHIAKLERKNARYSFSSRPVLHAFSSVAMVSVLLYGMYVLSMPLSEILVFGLLVHQLYEPLKRFNDENLTIQRGIVAAQRIYEVLDLDKEESDEASLTKCQPLKKELSFKNVSYSVQEESSNGQVQILNSVNFSIKPGETVALVGPTGAGKSTLINLIARLYKPQEGSILWDGTDVTELKIKSLRQQLAYVPQRPHIIADTVFENIAFGQKGVSLHEVVAAAKKAHAHEFIQSMAEGYETPLLEGGKNLSGGQQQRIAIARALLRNASILVLDEATSSLDTVSEQRVKQAMDELEGRTKIIIAHRLSTIANADRIYYLEQGKVLASGAKDELLETCPPFRQMWNAMFSGNQPTA